MKYPITPEYLTNAPKSLESIFRGFETWVIRDIVRRIKLSGELTSSAIEQLKVLKRAGYDEKALLTALKELSGLSDREFKRVFNDAVKRNEAYSKNILQDKYDADRMTATVNAMKKQTKGELENITRSLGFITRKNGNLVATPIAKAYEAVLDKAMLLVDTGAADYNTAIRQATKELTDSGLQFIDYETGWHNRTDVAVRRAINTGISQLSAKYTEQNMEELETKLVEVTAHRGARDVEGPHGWENHASWQGKVYDMEHGDKYPNLHDVCGYGEIDGLCGINCRHHLFPHVEGVTERTYTDAQLEELKGEPFTYEGKEYTIYEATQKQRQLETSIRKCKRELIAADALGDKEEYTNKSVRLRRLESYYNDFSSKAKLPMTELGNIEEFGPREYKVMENYDKDN